MKRLSIAFVGTLLISLSAHAAGPIKGKALLIGIEGYTKAAKLPGVFTDVRVLRDVLTELGGYDVTCINNSAPGPPMLFQRPERQRLEDSIESWLSDRKAHETVLLYFSGHGFRDNKNRLYLAAKDCDPKDPEPGGVPISWLREQLVACPAKMKLLVLDACHAGSARAAFGGNAVEATELNDFFGQIKGLVTLASCSGEQKSVLWSDKHQSLFTYWLAQGLSGHADREPLGEITVNELEDFVAPRVRESAKAIASHEQTPTRLQGPGVTENVVLQMRPISYKKLVGNLAEQMDAVIRLKGIERVGVVPQFACGTTEPLSRQDFGLWTTNAPAELVKELANKSRGNYRVIGVNTVRELLQEKEISEEDIGTSKSRGLTIEGRNLPALICGRIESLSPQTIALRCCLRDVTDGAVLGLAGGTTAIADAEAGGTATLSGAEAGMSGVSGEAELVAGSGDADTPPELRRVEIDAEADNPLRDAESPYRARIIVKDSDGHFCNRDLNFHGNRCSVALAKGEVFRIIMSNRSTKPVFARVLVDGLNTLPEKSSTKGVFVEPRTRDWHGDYCQAQPVNLIEAQAWGPLEPEEEYGVSGFFLDTGENAVFDEFKVVDAQRSLAAHSGYTDQLGIITVAFFEMQKKPPPSAANPKGARGHRGVGRGNRYNTQTDVYEGDYLPGRMLAVLHIRYGE